VVQGSTPQESTQAGQTQSGLPNTQAPATTLRVHWSFAPSYADPTQIYVSTVTCRRNQSWSHYVQTHSSGAEPAFYFRGTSYPLSTNALGQFWQEACASGGGTSGGNTVDRTGCACQDTWQAIQTAWGANVAAHLPLDLLHSECEDTTPYGPVHAWLTWRNDAAQLALAHSTAHTPSTAHPPSMAYTPSTALAPSLAQSTSLCTQWCGDAVTRMVETLIAQDPGYSEAEERLALGSYFFLPSVRNGIITCGGHDYALTAVVGELRSGNKVGNSNATQPRETTPRTETPSLAQRWRQQRQDAEGGVTTGWDAIDDVSILAWCWCAGMVFLIVMVLCLSMSQHSDTSSGTESARHGGARGRLWRGVAY
jgi:hypothetical protein